MKKVYLIEDDSDLIKLIDFQLSKDNYDIKYSKDATNIITKLENYKPDLIILDLIFPGGDGFQVCRDIKQNENLNHIPIIMLTGKSDEATIVAGLELGADDFVTKPFSMPVLTARIRKAMRSKVAYDTKRKAKETTFGNLRINLDEHEVYVNDTNIDLNNTEFKLLTCLSAKPGWVFNRIQIIDSIRGDGYIVTDRIIDVVIVSLRKKLAECDTYIQTVRGVGYRFKVES